MSQSSASFWIYVDGQNHGPYSPEEAARHVGPDSLVSDGGDWMRAAEHPVFAGNFRSSGVTGTRDRNKQAIAKNYRKKSSTVGTPSNRGNPSLALVLSFFLCGLGQLYNRDYLKAVVVFVAALIVTPLTLPFFGIAYSIPWLFSMVDAYMVADGRRSRWSLN